MTTGDQPGEDAARPAERAPEPFRANANPIQILRNFFAGYLGLAVAVVLGFVVTPIVLRHIGETHYALWVLIATFGTYVGLLGAGVGTATVQRVATEIAVGNNQGAAEVLVTARMCLLVSGTLAMVVTVAFLPFVADVFQVSHADLVTMRWGLLLMGAYSAAGLLSAVPTSALAGAGHNDLVSIVSLVVTVLVQGAQIAAVSLGGDVVALIAVTMAGAVVSLVLLDRVVRRTGMFPAGSARPTTRMARQLLRSGGHNVTVSLAGTITYGLDSFVVGAVLPVRKVAPYDLGLSVANALRNVATAATDLLLPTYAHSSALSDDARQFRLFTRAVLLSMMLTVPATVALIFFGRPLLGLWLGRVPDQTYEVLVVANVVFLLQLPGHQASVFLTGIGRIRSLARLALPLTVLNVAFSIAATFWLGVVGPLAGDLPQFVVVEFVILPLLCCRAVGRTYRDYARAVLVPLVVPAAVAVAVAVAVIAIAGFPHGLTAAPVAMAVVVVSVAACVAVQLRVDPSTRAILRTVSALLRRRRR